MSVESADPEMKRGGTMGQVHVMSLSEREGWKGSAAREVLKRRSMESKRESTCSPPTKTATSIVNSTEQLDCDSGHA